MNIKEKIIVINSKALEGGGTTSSAFSVIGSLPNLCHSLCMSIVSFIALFGITMNILPLMFLQTYRFYFWIAAFLLTGASFYFFIQQKRKIVRDRNFILINTGLLIFGLPFSFVADYMDLFRFVGLSLVVIGLFLLFFGKKFKFVDQPVLENAQSVVSASPKNIEILPLKFKLSSILFALVVGGFLVNQYMMYRLQIFKNTGAPIVSNTTSTMNKLSSMKLTPFDVALAKERMDKNNDGICDACGMPIQQCINSGQIDCNMGNNPNAIGLLGSQHIHADWKIYINEKQFDWTPFADLHAKQMAGDSSITNTSAFIHIHPAKTPEKGGDVLHMHAKKVPLWLFFRSLGITLSQDSLTTADGRILKNENGNTLKFYLNGKKVDELGDYIFQDLDKLLISYGPANDPNIQKQIDSVANFAKNH